MESPRAARAFVREILGDRAARVRENDVLLCVSELTTNALLHGTVPGQEFVLTVKWSAELVRIEVHDPGGGAPRVRSVEPNDCTGRGWALIRELADDHGIAKRDVGKVVWVSFKINPEPKT